MFQLECIHICHDSAEETSLQVLRKTSRRSQSNCICLKDVMTIVCKLHGSSADQSFCCCSGLVTSIVWMDTAQVAARSEHWCLSALLHRLKRKGRFREILISETLNKQSQLQTHPSWLSGDVFEEVCLAAEWVGKFSGAIWTQVKRQSESEVCKVYH